MWKHAIMQKYTQYIVYKLHSFARKITEKPRDEFEVGKQMDTSWNFGSEKVVQGLNDKLTRASQMTGIKVRLWLIDGMSVR